MDNPTVFIVIVLYLLMLIGLGIFAIRANVTGEDYLLGGRRMGPWIISMSEKASESSGFMTIGLPGEAYSIGLSAAWNSVTCVFSIFNWTVTAKRLRRYSEILKSITIPDYLNSRFADSTNSLRITGIIVMVLFQTVYVTAQFVAAGTVFEAVLGINYSYGVAIGGLIAIIYTIFGGFYAVSLSDFIQGLLIAFGLGVMPVVAIVQLGGFGVMGTALSETMGIGFNAPFFGETLLSLGVVVIILSYLAIGFGFLGNPHILIRYMAMRSTRNIKNVALMGILWMMIAYYGAVLIGMSGRVMFPGLDDAAQIYPLMAMELFPAWLAGVLIAAALSAMISSADSMLLIAASSVSEDLWNKTVKKGALPKKELLLISRIVTLILGVIGFFFALFPFDTVFWIAVFAWAGLASCFGPPIILSLLWKKVTKWGALAGMIVGPAVTIIWYYWKPIAIYEGGPAFLSALLAVFVVSLLTEPPQSSEFEKTWSIYDEKTEVGTFKPLTTVQININKELKNDNLKLHTEADIVKRLLNKRVISPSVYLTNGA